MLQTVQGAVLFAFPETVLQLLTILAEEPGLLPLLGTALQWPTDIPHTHYITSFLQSCFFLSQVCTFWDTWIFPSKSSLCSSPSHKPHATGEGRKESSFSQKGLNSCFFAWGFPQSAQKQSCSTGSTLNLRPQGFPLPAHRWHLPKPSASLMQKAPLVPSLLLPEASMWIWQSKKQVAFLPESPLYQSL